MEMFTILIVMMGMDIHKNKKLSNCTLQICHLLDSITDLAGYSPWGSKESDTTEHAHTGKTYKVIPPIISKVDCIFTQLLSLRADML